MRTERRCSLVWAECFSQRNYLQHFETFGAKIDFLSPFMSDNMSEELVDVKRDYKFSDKYLKKEKSLSIKCYITG